MTLFRHSEAPLSDSEPIAFRRPPVAAGGQARRPSLPPSPGPSPAPAAVPVVAFSRIELNAILNVYGRRVAAGDWRDYAIDLGSESACFSVFRRASEIQIYRIEKTPRLARKQGAFSVITATGLILKRGSDLRRVLAVLDKGMRVVD